MATSLPCVLFIIVIMSLVPFGLVEQFARQSTLSGSTQNTGSVLLMKKKRVWYNGSLVEHSFLDLDFIMNTVDDDCVLLAFSGRYQRRLTRCSYLYPFVCTKPKGSCPEGWFNYENNCYKAFLDNSDLKTIEEAITNCSTYSSHLPYIQDSETNFFIYNAFESTSNFLWLGLNDTEGNGEHKWLDGTNLTYNNWAKGNPTVGLPCAAMSFNAEWYSLTCSHIARYVCVRPEGGTTTIEPTTTTTTTTTTTPTTTTTTSSTTSSTITTTTSTTTTTTAATTTTTTETTPTSTASSDKCSWELACNANNRKKRSDKIGGFRKVRRNGGIYLIPEGEFIEEDYP